MFDFCLELLLYAGFSYSLLNVALWYESQSDQGNCVSRGHAVLLLCGNIYCLKWYSWSPITKPGQQALTNMTKRHVCCCICPLHGVCFLVFTGMCACVCENRNTFADLRVCVCVCLTSVLWLVIAGNPSTSQSKKTIKQRFLKLLPCCKPSAAPSISQSKCSFTLYTSLLSSMCPASLVNYQNNQFTNPHTFIQNHT